MAVVDIAAAMLVRGLYGPGYNAQPILLRAILLTSICDGVGLFFCG